MEYNVNSNNSSCKERLTEDNEQLTASKYTIPDMETQEQTDKKQLCSDTNNGNSTASPPKKEEGGLLSSTMLSTPNKEDRDHTFSAASDGTALLSSAPDGGWAWVVCLASFICMVICDGMLFSFGVLFIDLLEYFDAGNSKTALIGSLFMGMSMAGGPVVSSLINVFGIRKVTIAGSVITFLSFAVSPLATSVDMLAFTYGFCGGFGVCMIYISSIVVIGFYFDKQRAFANGLSASGSGVGVFIYSILCRYLQDEFTWKGAVFILAAITLHTAICGVLFRPIKIRKQIPDLVINDTGTTDPNESLLSQSYMSINSETSNVCDKKTGEVNESMSLIPQEETENHHITHNITDTSDSAKPQQNPHQNDFLQLPHTSVVRPAFPLRLNPNLSHIYSSVPRLSPDKTDSNSKPVNLCYSADQLSHPQKEQCHKENLYFKPLERRDIFYSGSMKRLPDFNPYSDVAMETIGIETDSKFKRFCRTTYRVLGLKLLSNPVFSLIVFYSLLWTTHSTILTITPKYATDVGISKSDASLLISALGVTNIMGRIIAGWVSDKPQVEAVYVVASALFVGGIACFCMPFTQMFYVLLAEVSVFGFCMATWTSLRPIVLVDLLGIDNLTSSLGLLALFQGIAFCIGPPLAGLIYDHTQSYMIPYLMAGLAFVFAGFVCLPLPRLANYWAKRQEHQGLI